MEMQQKCYQSNPKLQTSAKAEQPPPPPIMEQMPELDVIFKFFIAQILRFRFVLYRLSF